MFIKDLMNLLSTKDANKTEQFATWITNLNHTKNIQQINLVVKRKEKLITIINVFITTWGLKRMQWIQQLTINVYFNII